MAELRLILSGLGVVAIAAIWWWSTRRSGQAPGNSELRESSVLPIQNLAPAPEGRERAPEPRDRVEVRDRPETRDRPEMRDRPDFRDRTTIAPLEPLSIRTADFDRVPILDLPMMAHPEPPPAKDADAIDVSILEMTADPLSADIADEAERSPGPTVEPEPAASPAPASEAPLGLSASTENGDRLAPVESPSDEGERQKIVTLRVCAVGEDRWSGRDLMAVLEGHGLAYGQYQVYHRKHADGRSIFYVASLIEPGTFDANRMAEEEFRGVSMFAVLPGPVEPLQAVDALLATARELARALSGTVQDAKGMPFSPQRIATLREDVARYQSARGPAA
ncbi:MAG: cell division protein ZipA C-terminal FtsZ-binding domain-containing protein [Steroidobacteraceae bacterium]